ncbi:hypothetical protein [Streptomyces sp. 7N604]|uniref:hypothetical protein n=1 Tax=Streptomyces sp. 7N604 TaxID=3457415 RepID=UPI003FD21606
MTSFWTGKRIRLRGIEPDDWTAFMRFTGDEERLGDVLHPTRSAEGYRDWAKEQAAAKSEAIDTGEKLVLSARTTLTHKRAGSSTASRSALITAAKAIHLATPGRPSG